VTLVELLVVMAIIGLIVGISVPALTTYASRTRLKTTTRQMLGMLSLARSLAISSREEHALVVDAGRREIRVVNKATGEALERVLRMPDSMSVDLQIGGEPSQGSEVVFRPTGGLAGRTVALVLADRDKTQTITVTGATGAVMLQ
jgi:Tfp pilus assembly protein FimT